MNREKELARNTLILTIGRISTQIITFLLLPLYTGILSTEEYGMVDLVNTLIMVCVPVLSLQIDQGTFRMLIDDRNSEVWKQSVVTNAMACIVVDAILFCGIGLPMIICLDTLQWHYFIWIVIVITGTNLLLQIARGVNRITEYAYASFFISTSTILFNVIFLVGLKLGVKGMLMGTLFGQCVGFAYLWLKLRMKQYVSLSKLKKETVTDLLKYSLPLVPNSVSWWVFNSSDRIIVTAFLGLSMNGILSASSKFSGAYIALYNIFVLSWTESVCVHIDDDDIQYYFNKMFNLILKIFFFIALVLMSMISLMYSLLINHRYIAGYALVPLHMLGAFLNVILGLFGAVYIAKKETKTVMVTALLSAIFNILFCLLLIRPIGLYAGPVSTIAAFAVMVLVRSRDIGLKYFRIVYDKKLMLFMIVSWLIVMFLYYQDSSLFHLLGIVFSVLLFCVKCRDVIGTVVQVLNNKLKGRR